MFLFLDRIFFLYNFFFSSRRRHTILQGDWSSDVCSSDLIACGAISGFHALISSGTTPKLITSEGDARLVGYGGMLTESAVRSEERRVGKECKCRRWCRR